MSDTESDLEVLFPDQDLTIAGERLTVREFRYREGLQAAVIARPIIAGLRELVAAGTEIGTAELDVLLADHDEAWLRLVAMSCDRPVEWVAGLPHREAMNLHIAFWGANNHFFTSRLLFAAALEAAASRSRSRKSSPTSSGPDSGVTSTISPGASPGDRSAATGG